MTNIRDPLIIKQHILNRMNYAGAIESYQFYHENGWHPSKNIQTKYKYCY